MGNQKKTLRWTYTVKTEVDTYSFDFVIVYSDFDKNDTGLFQLCIVKESDTYRNYFWILRDDVPGVLWGIHTPEDYAAGVTRALTNGDKNDVAAMFSKEAYQKLDNLTSEIERATKMFRSYVDYDHFPKVNVLSKETTANQTSIRIILWH